MSVSIVVPARNEAGNIGSLLESLAADEPREIVVVDDESTDATAAIAAAGGARVVAAPPRPPGWTGKTWACWTGAETATGDVVVFVDADVRFAPSALATLLAEQRRSGGLVSVQPYATTRRAYEQMSLFFNVVGVVASDLHRTAFGPCMVCSRDNYFAVGGHAAVRGEVTEDVALGDRFRSHGFPVDGRLGGFAVRYRMYPLGLAQLAEGWTKNFATGAGRTRPLTLLGVVAWIAAYITAPVAVATTGAAGIAVYALAVAELAWFARRVGDFRWWAIVAYPIPLAFFLVVFARSLVATAIRREVSWRGRRIAIGGR